MGKLKIKVKIKVLLHDPLTGYVLDFPEVGTVKNDVPDNDFWRGKVREGYLDMLGVVEEGESNPLAKRTKTELENLAVLKEVELDGAKTKAEIIEKLEAAGVTEEDTKLLEELS